MSLTPYTLQITSEGKCLYSHQFVQFKHNQHLLTGMISALQSLYAEVFAGELGFLMLEDYQILTQKIGEIQLYLIFQGNRAEADVFMTEILDLFCQNSVISDFELAVETSVINSSAISRVEMLITTSFQPELSSATT